VDIQKEHLKSELSIQVDRRQGQGAKKTITSTVTWINIKKQENV